MQTSARIQVQPAELRSLALRWRNQEWDLRSARDALAAGPSDALVARAVGGFLVAWATEIGELGVGVGSVADGLAAAGSDFADFDAAVADR